MTKNGNLQWDLSEVQGFLVGRFEVVGVISDIGGNGLVLSCTDAANHLYAMKIERKPQLMDKNNIVLHEILNSPLDETEQNLYIPRLEASFREQGREIFSNGI